MSQVPAFALKLNMGSPLKTLESLKNGELEEYSAFERCLVETLLSPTSDVSKCASLMAKNPDQALDWAWLLLT
ncbi:hypothetical protein OFO11_32730, partial [Escherichia coli]|nr:hypothetical protein [Escherichia coli]